MFQIAALVVLGLLAGADAAAVSGSDGSTARSATEKFTCASTEPPADVKQAVQQKIKAHLASRSNANARTAFATVNINVKWHVITQASKQGTGSSASHSAHLS